MKNTATLDAPVESVVTNQERLERIDGLDLEPIVYKLTISEYGKPPEMTLEQADHAVSLYRMFLKLTVMYPEKDIVPTRLIDSVWHTHILDTAKYRTDCLWALGRFLDHFPYLGLRGDEDVRVWQAAFTETRRLFLEHFGVKLDGGPEKCEGPACKGHCEAEEYSGSGCTGLCKGHCVDTDTVRPRPNRALLTA